MSAILGKITSETTKATKEIEDLSSPLVASAVKKRAINNFAEFLLTNATALKQNASAARSNVGTFFESQVALLEMATAAGRQEDYLKEKEEILQALNAFVAIAIDVHTTVLDYRKTLEVIPRMTTRFNQARRELIDALEQSLMLFGESEANSKDLIARIERSSEDTINDEQ
jgi:hypothetical protein